MEQITSFDAFYDIKLKPYMGDLQKQSREAKQWGIASIIAGILLVPGLVLGTTILGGWTIASVIILVLVCVYNYTRVNDRYEDGFKQHVIRQIIEFINPNLQYKPDAHIHSSHYRNSCLCRKNYEYYNGDDLVEGQFKNVAFKCSELDVTNSRGGAIFRGLFFTANINQAFTGGTYVWSRGNEQLPVTMADEHYRMMPMPKTTKVNLGNGYFENHYSVYTTDVDEACTIVDEQMMQCITDLKNQTGRQLALSFVAGMCYVAIPFNEELLESESGNPANKEEIKKYFFTILMILSIINKLQLARLQ